jgi:hypothetical protein
VSSLSWLRDGTLLVEYLDVSGPEERWNLVGVAPDGTRRFEYPDTPRLLATTPDDKMVLLDPDAELPNQWITAAFRR